MEPLFNTSAQKQICWKPIWISKYNRIFHKNQFQTEITEPLLLNSALKIYRNYIDFLIKTGTKPILRTCENLKNHHFFVTLLHLLLVSVPHCAVLVSQVGLHGSWWPTHPRNRFPTLHTDCTAWMFIQCKEIPDRGGTLGILAFFQVFRNSVVGTWRAWRDFPLPAFNARHFAVRIFPNKWTNTKFLKFFHWWNNYFRSYFSQFLCKRGGTGNSLDLEKFVIHRYQNNNHFIISNWKILNLNFKSTIVI